MPHRRLISPRVVTFGMTEDDYKTKAHAQPGDVYKLSNGFWYVRNPMSDRDMDPSFGSEGDADAYKNKLVEIAMSIVQRHSTH